MQAALKLAPNNGAIADLIARALERQHKLKESVPYFNIAAQYGTGDYAERAKVSAECIMTFYAQEQERIEIEARAARLKKVNVAGSPAPKP